MTGVLELLLPFIIIAILIFASIGSRQAEINAPISDEKLLTTALSFEHLICEFKRHRVDVGRPDEPWNPSVDFTPNVLAEKLSNLTEVLGRRKEHREELKTMMHSSTITPGDWCHYANELVRKYSADGDRPEPNEDKIRNFLPQLEQRHAENT